MAFLRSLRQQGTDSRPHVLFVLSLATLLVLGAWWIVLLGEKVHEVHSLTLERERLATLLAAWQMKASGIERPPEASGLELVPADPRTATDLDVAVAPGRVLRPAKARLEAIARTHRMQVIQVAGEGALLIVLIGVSMFMLYRLVLVEGSVRRSTESFLGTVTHELKTPVAGIKALLQTLALRNVPEERRLAFLEMGLREAARLQHLIDNVLVANRIARERLQVSIQKVELGPLLEREIEMRRQLLPAARELALECEAGLAASADPEAVGIVVENLLDNALKYSPTEPRILVRAARDGAGVAVAVIDNGLGIEAADMTRIFEPFHRATQGGTKGIKGTGLGLHIARSLARAIGGELLAASPGPGRGSTFTLRLRPWP